MILTGPYRIDHYAFDVKVALTNKCGAGPMRAPMSITSWVMDGTIDAIARKLGRDPLEVRRINALRSQDMPYTMATGEVVEDITPLETMDAAIAAIDYAAFPQAAGGGAATRPLSRRRCVHGCGIDRLRLAIL